VAFDDELLMAVFDRIEDLRPAPGCLGRRDSASHDGDDIR